MKRGNDVTDPVSVPTSPAQDHLPAKKWLGVILFLAIAAIGLYWAKWNPYYQKAFVAAAKHSIGSSIISGKSAVSEPPSWHAAWDYSLSYFNAIYKALIVSVLLGSLVQVLIPRDWMVRLLGSNRYTSTWIAGVSSLPGMM